MKAITSFCFMMFLFVITANAIEQGPVAVSPGADIGIAAVGETCPTFSWTAVDWAAAYNVVIFETSGPQVLALEEMNTIAIPILTKQIHGRSLSWTPSSNERLRNGGMYVWYVQAVDTYGTVVSSEGKVFQVGMETRFIGMEETMGESLKEHGVSEEIIEEVLEDMKSEVREVVVWGVDLQGDVGGQKRLGIQDIEGETTNNTFFGLDAGLNLGTYGLFNSFFGHSAGYNTSTGDENTFVGHYSGVANISGRSNTFMGYFAGHNNTASYNSFIGMNSGYNNNSGSYNAFMGYYAGYANTTAGYNTFMGANSGRSNSTGTRNTFMGHNAGYHNIWADYNTFIGNYAGYNNTYGITEFGEYSHYNTFIGQEAGRNNTSGYRNTFIGHQAGYSNQTGLDNVYLGRTTGRSNQTGNRNVFLGKASGYSNLGHGNVFLGYNSGVNETGSEKLYIDNSDTISPLIYGEFDNHIVTVHGKFGVGTKSPAFQMEIETTGENAIMLLDRTDGATSGFASFGDSFAFGTVTNHPVSCLVNSAIVMSLRTNGSLLMSSGARCTSTGVWTNASSREYKENIQEISTDEAMDALERLNPVKYNYKKDKEEEYVGFISEDVPDLVASKDRKSMSAMDVVAVLTKVVQEQQKIAEEQQKTINQFKKKIDELEKKLK
jgi:hypothetical protein